jgi:apolipoprotein N-acyltransferase
MLLSDHNFQKRARLPVALVAGFLLAAAFPGINIAGLAWIAPGMMLAATLGSRPGESFRLGYSTGLAFWLTSLYWLLLIPVPGFPILGWVALSAFLALFQGTWTWLCWRCFPSPVPASDSPPSRQNDVVGTGSFHRVSRLSRMRWALVCAVLWVALEMIRARILSGFPWSLLGVSQFQLVPLIQISSVTGVYGVSFLVAWTSVTLLCAGLMLLGPNAGRSTLATEVFTPLVVVAVVFATGFYRVTHAPQPARTVRFTAVQPSIPQTMIWDPKADDQRFAELLALTRRALSNETDVLLWPEAALPALNASNYASIVTLASEHQAWFIFGADDVKFRDNGTNESDLVYYNAAWLLSPRDQIINIYHKQRLVIFGEFIPLAEALPFVKWLTPITGSFTAGKSPALFNLRDARVNAAPLICFEDVFPHGAREHVTDATDLLVNLTNDGWFGESAEQWQHAANAVYRAVENGVPLVRSCNNGLTCWVDPQGRIRQIFRDRKGTIYGPGFATFDVGIEGTARPHTYYNRHGDVFGWACVVLGILAVARTFPGAKLGRQ